MTEYQSEFYPSRFRNWDIERDASRTVFNSALFQPPSRIERKIILNSILKQIANRIGKKDSL